jgi:transcriptional regulator with XRE-family HTH domain
MREAIATEIGLRIRLVRELGGISSRELSRLSGLAPPHVWMIETGEIQRPDAITLLRIARTTGCRLDWLIAGGAPTPTREIIRASIAAARGGGERDVG